VYRATSLISWCSRNSAPGSHFFCIPTSFLWEGLLPSIIFETKFGPLSCCSRISRGNGYHLHERVRHLQLQPTSYDEKKRKKKGRGQPVSCFQARANKLASMLSLVLRSEIGRKKSMSSRANLEHSVFLWAKTRRSNNWLTSPKTHFSNNG